MGGCGFISLRKYRFGLFRSFAVNVLRVFIRSFWNVCVGSDFNTSAPLDVMNSFTFLMYSDLFMIVIVSPLSALVRMRIS